MSNFHEARKWLLIAFCFKNPFSLITILEEMTRIFFLGKSFMRCGQLVYQLLMAPQNRHTSYNNLFSHSCLKVSTNSSNSTLLASPSHVVNPKFMIYLSNHCSNIVIESSSSLGYYLGFKTFNALKIGKSRNLLSKLSTIVSTYIAPHYLAFF